ncbi:MAG TPA: ATP-binding protein, partial [Terriglobales bacterium]|nr:ATP-binding protein [Terriglobales bacterium]
GVPVLEPDGGIREWVGTCSDIHERKQIEDELRKQAVLLNLAHDAILVRDLQSRIVFWNRGAEETYGWTAQEAAGQLIHELLYTRSATPLPAIEAAVEKEGEWEGELTHKTRVGSTIIVASRWSLQRDHNGSPSNILEINRDISERKQLEENLRQRTLELENSVAELEAFSYSVSHDLRAPLRSIDGFSQILLEDYRDKVDAEGQDALRRIRNASQNMGQLIDALLQLSRVMRGELQHESVDLSLLALSTAALVQKADPSRRVSFHVANRLETRGDRRLLGVALQNLLQNAWKFTARTSEPLVEFGSVPRDGKTAYYVRDNGVGFDMTYVDKLFTPFQRLHAKEQFEGTGIGLATVQRIIKRHGGKVWAEGAVGKGATFYFSLD